MTLFVIPPIIYDPRLRIKSVAKLSRIDVVHQFWVRETRYMALKNCGRREIILRDFRLKSILTCV